MPSLSTVFLAKHSCRLLVIGGGAGGCSIASKFTRRLGKNAVIVLEPSMVHYYQPMFTLVGGGIKSLAQSLRPMASVLPTDARWLKDEAADFDPQNNRVTTKSGDEISYDFMVVAMGIQLNYDKIPGLVDALDSEESGVCSNYSPRYAEKTFRELRRFRRGNAVFTFPNTPVKCAGAPQKIMYLAEHFMRKQGLRSEAAVSYRTALPVLFGVKAYADALWPIVRRRDIDVVTRSELTEVRHRDKVAVFRNLDKPEKITEIEFSLLHATPPQGPPDVLKRATPLVDAAGFLDVDAASLRNCNHDNVFGVGDCTNAPTSKTAAAVAGQVGVVATNLEAAMSGRPPPSSYDGYTSCPLVTGYGSCILAEFDYSLTPRETLPFRQDRETTTAYYLKTLVLPEIYWKMMLRGYWNGPAVIRKALHMGGN